MANFELSAGLGSDLATTNGNIAKLNFFKLGTNRNHKVSAQLELSNTYRLDIVNKTVNQLNFIKLSHYSYSTLRVGNSPLVIETLENEVVLGYLEYYPEADKKITIRNLLITGSDIDTVNKIRDTFAAMESIITPKPNPNIVALNILNYSDGKLIGNTKELSNPSTDIVSVNYSKSVRSALSKISLTKTPLIKRGKILLLNGVPGTGKTNLIKHIVYQQGQIGNVICSVISDPERLLNDMDYMNQLMVSRDLKLTTGDYVFRAEDTANLQHFILIEDDASLFALHCRDKPGFSRLLNLADGILGADQNICFILTANETIDKIDPAILRPGRLIANLHVGPLSEQEAKDWCKYHEVSITLHLQATLSSKKEITLAELYSIKNGLELETQPAPKFGFK